MSPLQQILVVEDNPGDFVILRERLDHLNPPPKTVLHASTLGDALKVLKTQCPDAVFLDLGLPDSRGLETLDAIQSQYKDGGPVIVVTGLDDAELGVEAVERGAQDFLSKSDLDNERILIRSLLYALERNRTARIQSISKECLRRLADGMAIEPLITFLLERMESLAPGIRGCFMRPSADRRKLRVTAAPNLQPAWVRLIDKTRIGEHSLPCGQAAFRNKRIMVQLDANSVPIPRLLEVARQHAIRACWAEPIQVGEQIEGVFVFLLSESRVATADEIRCIDSLREVAQAILKHELSGERLDRTESRFLTLYEQACECVLIYDSHFVIQDANPAATMLFGYTRDELVGSEMRLLQPSGALTGSETILSRRLSNGQIVRFEDHRVRKDGTIVPLQISSSCVRNGDEQFFMEICMDISEIRQKELNLLQLNRVLKALREINGLITLEKNPHKLIREAVNILVGKRGFYHAWIVLLDESGNVRDHAEASNYRLEQTLASILNEGHLPECMKLASEANAFFCTDHPTVACVNCPVKKTGIDHGAFSVQLQHEGKRYGYLSVASAPNLVASMDEQELFCEIGKDLSMALHTIHLESRERDQEMKYRLLAENSTDCIWMLSKECMVEYINPAVRNILGYRENEILGNCLLDFAVPESARSAREAFVQVLLEQSRRKIETIEIEFLHKDHSVVPCEVAVKSLLNGSGGSVGLQGSMRAVTERKRVERELMDAKAIAESANAAKDEFLAVMSHEMRTPLNPIMGLTQLLLEDGAVGEQREFLQSIYDAAVRELELVDNILNYTKLDRGKVKPTVSVFSILELCDQVIQDAKFIARNLSLEFINPAPGSGKPVHANLLVKTSKSLIQRVIMNLMGNACKYTREGFVRFGVAEVSRTEREVVVMFCVEDSGIGIDPSSINRLFHPFEQLDTSLTREFDGVGLGLAISKKIADTLGGEIWVESNLNKGSKFSFTLPMELVNSPLATEQDSPGDEAPWTQDGQVLLVEDRDSNASVAVAMIKKFGLELHRVSNGLECLEACDRQDYDLILMDLAMPIMDGIEATRRIRSTPGLNRETPIWALTADLSDERKAICKAAGMQGYLEKPLNSASLKELLASVYKGEVSKKGF